MRSMKEALMRILNQAGIRPEEAGAWAMGSLLEKNKVCLSLRQIVGVPGALFQYLGTGEDGDEIYGMELTVRFGLTLLCPKQQGATGAEDFEEEILNGLMLSLGDLGAREISCSEVQYDSLRDCFRQEITVENRVMAYGTRGETGMELTGFRVKAAVL